MTTPTGRAMASLLSIFAEFQRKILKERVKAGIAHARALGKKHGRPHNARANASQLDALTLLILPVY